jgi:hypothetical protein
VGDADAGSFALSTILDPRQSVAVNSAVPGGLGAGASMAIGVVTPPGGNCFDPDCTIRAEVDSGMTVRECKEDNNTLEETTRG